MNTDRSEEEVKQVVLHVSESESSSETRRIITGSRFDGCYARNYASRRNDTVVCSCAGEAPIETAKQPASATPTKSTAKRKMLKVRIVPFVCS